MKNKKCLPISISSNKILKILLNSTNTDANADFDNLFAKIKSVEEKNAIAFLTIGLGNINYSGLATTYIMEKLSMDCPFQLKYIPTNEIKNFWKYMPSFVNSNKNICQFFHALLPYIPNFYDDEILSSLMNIKTESQILLYSYVKSIDNLIEILPKFLKMFFIENFPTVFQIQYVTSILIKFEETFPVLIKIFDICKNNETRYSVEYAIIYSLSSFNGTFLMINNVSTLMMLFLRGVIDFKSQLFESLCFFINSLVASIEPPKTKEESDDYPFYLFMKMKEENALCLKSIVKQAMKKIDNLAPMSIYYLFAIDNENLSEQLAFRLIKLDNPLPVIEKCIKKGESTKNENMLNLIYHVICTKFLRTPIDDPLFKPITDCMKKVHEICFPIQFLSKIADMICEPDFRDLALELLKIDDESRSNVFLKINEIVEADYPTNKIDENIQNEIDELPTFTVHAFIAYCSSISYTSSRTRKNRLISFMKRELLTSFNELDVSFDVISSTIPELDSSITDFKELFTFLKKSCGNESHFHDISDELFNQAIQD